ncbi:MAG: hypothetical protein LBR80_15065 [Deltaproteobacteria bacterium]|jgi:uncharacterized phage-associated protein|nr:hypothetical protein [Deltaproteobacteria bacterium]
MDSFWTQYSGLDQWLLVAASHAEGSPWHRIVSSPVYDRYTNSLMPIELIRSYFESQLAESA